jgi:HlyD family secretion protein
MTFLTARRGLAILAAVLVAAAMWWALVPPPVDVDTQTVDRGRVAITVEDEGTTRIRDVFKVYAPVAGRVLRLPVHVGDEVRKGESIVAVMQPVEPSVLDLRTRLELGALVRAGEAAVAFAEAELARSVYELRFAESELDRAKSLAVSKTISERALEKAGLDVELQRAQLRRAEAMLESRRRELETAKARLVEPGSAVRLQNGTSSIELKAPADGKILSVVDESEQVVAAGSMLVEVGDPRDLEIVADFLSTDAVKVVPGQTALIEGWGGSPPLRAKVRLIEPKAFAKVSALGIEEQRVNVLLDLEAAQAGAINLGHSFHVIVRILISEFDDVPRVPVSALFRTGTDWATYAVENGRATLRTLKIGACDDRYCVIERGLDEGAVVVLYPSDRIKIGMHLDVRRAQ